MKKLSFLLASLILTSEVLAQIEKAPGWIEKPWAVRYMIFVWNQDLYKISMEAAQDLNTRKTINGKDVFALEARGLFAVPSRLALPHKKSVVTVLINFDEAGRANSPALTKGPWIAKRDMLDYLLLIDEKKPSEKPYLLASWSQGIPGDWSFSPAVCGAFDEWRYMDDWTLSEVFGGFGCREWTAQLYRWEQPYIDVTSYDTNGPFIGEFVGWSRFTDPHKPVIGLHGKSWLCLHECPLGEKPGVIKNIKGWTRKHGFPMPQRPPKQPLYPNSDYLDDIHELDE